MSFFGDELALLFRHKTVGAVIQVAVFNPLQDSGYADLEKFIKIARGYRKKLQPLQRRIILIFRLFQHTPVEFEPGGFAIDEVRGLVVIWASHGSERLGRSFHQGVVKMTV